MATISPARQRRIDALRAIRDAFYGPCTCAIIDEWHGWQGCVIHDSMIPKTPLITKFELARQVRAMSGLSRSERWTGACEDWARFIHEEDDIAFAFSQGGVWFGYATLGLGH